MTTYTVKDDYDEKVKESNLTKGLFPGHATYTRKNIKAKPLQEDLFGSAISDKYWVDDLFVLFRSDRVVEFLPSKKHTVNEQLNAMTRFFIYLGILTSLTRKSTLPLFFITVIPISIITFYFFNSPLPIDEDLVENFDNERPAQPNRRLMPTKDNPFMNLDMTMYGTADALLPPADVTDPQINAKIIDCMKSDMPSDMYSIDDQNQAFLNFYTVPRTLDYGEFADYLYKLPDKSYKEDPSKYIPDIR